MEIFTSCHEAQLVRISPCDLSEFLLRKYLLVYATQISPKEPYDPQMSPRSHHMSSRSHQMGPITLKMTPIGVPVPTTKRALDVIE